MSYIYISEAKLRRGGVYIAQPDLVNLPEAVLKKAIENNVIKKKNERRSKKDSEEESVENEG